MYIFTYFFRRPQVEVNKKLKRARRWSVTCLDFTLKFDQHVYKHTSAVFSALGGFQDESQTAWAKACR